MNRGERLTEHARRHPLLWYVAIVVTVTLCLQFGIGPALHHWIYG